MKTSCSIFLLFVIPFTGAAIPSLPSLPTPGVSGCTMPSGGSGTVVIALKPSTADIIANMGSNKSALAIVEKLQSVTDTAAALIKTATGGKIDCRCKWITSECYCDGLTGTTLKMVCTALGPALGVISTPISFPLPALPNLPTQTVTSLLCQNDVNGQPWGLDRINAAAAWAAGFKGAGVKVGSIDTGARGTHSELGNDRMCNSLEYSWSDPYGISTSEATDVHGHGTHTLATMVGKTVGVAPEACWMSCRGCDSDSCEQEQLVDCGQFMACPDNKAQQCSTRAQVINNSWGGGIGNTFYDSIMAVWKSMQISYSFAAGNSGPACSTVSSPADHNTTKYSFASVASTTCDNKISDFSSRGPSQMAEYMGGTGITLGAPGSAIRSAWHTSDTDFQTLDGTSMASPHAGGAMAVLLSQDGTRTPDQIIQILTKSANQESIAVNMANSCNVPTNTQSWPNSALGYGVLDIGKAVTTA